MRTALKAVFVTALISISGFNASFSAYFSSAAAGSFVYTNSNALGISDLYLDWDDSVAQDKIEFEFGGFIYKKNIPNGLSLSGILMVDNPADHITLIMPGRINNTGVSDHSYYETIDYTKYINVKNLIIDIDWTVSQNLSNKISLLPRLENVYITRYGKLPPTLNNPSLKNIILCYNAYYPSYLWNGSTLNLSQNYSTGIKFVTIDSFKYSQHFYLRSYLNNPNYKGNEDLQLYVVPDNEFQIPHLWLIVNKRASIPYKEYAGVKFLPWRTAADDIFKYTFGYVDPLITKTVFNPSAYDKENKIIGLPIHTLDTLYLMEGATKECLKIKAKTLVTEIPVDFIYQDYSNYENVYFYPTAKTSELKIISSSLDSTTQVTVNFYMQELISTTTITIDNPYIAAKIFDYAGDKLPEFAVSLNGYSVTTRNLDKPFSEMISELNILIDADNQGNSNNDTNSVFSSLSTSVNSSSNSSDDSNHTSIGKEEKTLIVEAIMTASLSVAGFLILFWIGKKAVKCLKKLT